MTVPVPALRERARACAERLREADQVLAVSHIDADGLTSGAIASSMLERAGIDHEIVFEKQLDADAIAAIAATDYDTVLFTDFGSGQLDVIAAHEERGDFTPIIADHHQPATDDDAADDAAATGTPTVDPETEFHLNPLLFGLDGASELSGAGTTYCLARALEHACGDDHPDNRDLAALAVVGAVGDMQANASGQLVGANRRLVEEGTEAGVLEEGTDLAIYGTQTRPLPKLLEYAGDTPIPGITGDQAGAIRFLESTGVDLKDETGDWRRWVHLTAAEKQTVASALVQRAVKRGVPAVRVNELVGTTYLLTDEVEGTELRDASEFSTLLNATARYERADVGLAVCLGDREEAFDRARKLLANHRRNLSEGIRLVEQEGVEKADHIQWFDAGDRIRETIVGIVAGMAMGADGIDRDRPIIAFATKTEDGTGNELETPDEVKVSARATPALVRRGVDLSVVMRDASREAGGDGGGHDIAAGATIPLGGEDAFIAAADRITGEQLGE